MGSSTKTRFIEPLAIMTHALVTGASGFIGYHLVKYLTRRGHQVTCLVRPSSDRSRIEPFQPRFAIGDVSDRSALCAALDGIDVVYHLAGTTKCLRPSDFQRINGEGTRNIAASCAACDSPPTLVYVSSLAAAGPSTGQRRRIEADVASPVSNYGRSKLAGETIAREYAADVPISIVRPPIVLGEADRDGLEMFKGIAQWGVHLVPSLIDDRVSVIHAEDLAAALLMTANHGRRILPMIDSNTGIYFAAGDEAPSYADLGRMIGKSLGRKRILVIRTLKTSVWCIAAINEIIAQIRKRPHILSLDKAREATAGSWTCSANALRADTGFAPHVRCNNDSMKLRVGTSSKVGCNLVTNSIMPPNPQCNLQAQQTLRATMMRHLIIVKLDAPLRESETLVRNSPAIGTVR